MEDGRAGRGTGQGMDGLKGNFSAKTLRFLGSLFDYPREFAEGICCDIMTGDPDGEWCSGASSL
ncbi:MAG: hypothetical protein ACE5LX_09845 [Nitrospinota bacterium]